MTEKMGRAFKNGVSQKTYQDWLGLKLSGNKAEEHGWEVNLFMLI